MGMLQNTAALVTVLAESGPMSHAEIADRISMPRASVYRLVEALAGADLVELLPDARVRASLRWLRLAESASAGLTEWSHARSILDNLAAASGLTVFFSLPRGERSICVDWAPGTALNVLILRPGKSLPLHAGAAGRVTLAHLTAAAIDAYLAHAPYETFTPHTLTRAAQLRTDITTTRRQGYVVSDQDVTIGIGALGAPVLEPGAEQLLGALSIAGTSDDVDRRRPELVDLLVAAAEALATPFRSTGPVPA
jgi:DNA-binding IclR family transcriptional regulator